MFYDMSVRYLSLFLPISLTPPVVTYLTLPIHPIPDGLYLLRGPAGGHPPGHTQRHYTQYSRHATILLPKTSAQGMT